jgi:hypothetical protein
MSEEMYPCIVEEANKPPSRCLFSQDHDGPWIDTGVKAFGVHPHGYISVRYVEEVARDLLGMVSRSEVNREFQELRGQLEALSTRLDEVEEFRDTLCEYDDQQRKLEGALPA